MNWLLSLLRGKRSPKGTSSVTIKVGMSYDKIKRLLGPPRDAGVSGADILGRGSRDPRVSDVFIYFEKHPSADYSIRFSHGKVVSFKEYPKS